MKGQEEVRVREMSAAKLWSKYKVQGHVIFKEAGLMAPRNPMYEELFKDSGLMVAGQNRKTHLRCVQV